MNKTTVDLLNTLYQHPLVNDVYVFYDGLVYFRTHGHTNYRARGRWGKITVEYYDSEPFIWLWYHEGRYTFDEFEKWLEGA